MAKKEPKTLKGRGNKILTGDGRRSVERVVRETMYGKKKKR